MRPPRRPRINRRALVDASRAKQKLSLAEANAAGIAADTLESLGTLFVDMIEKVSPRDTNRFVRAYQLAANDAGLPPRPVLPIERSSNHSAYLRALEKQVQYWEGQQSYFQGLIDMMDEQDRTAGPKKNGKRRKRRRSSPSYRRYKREARLATKETEAAYAQLREALGSESFLLFDKGGFAEGRVGGYGKRKRFRSTIRTKVYGGRGRIDLFESMAILTLENLEPHASIVARSARHGRPVEFAIAAVRALGGQSLSRKAAASIARVSGLRAGNAAALIGAEGNRAVAVRGEAV